MRKIIVRVKVKLVGTLITLSQRNSLRSKFSLILIQSFASPLNGCVYLMVSILKDGCVA